MAEETEETVLIPQVIWALAGEREASLPELTDYSFMFVHLF